MTARLGLGGAGVSIGKAKFPIVLKHAIDSATPASVQEAFAVTGICPYNPQAIDTTQLVDDSFNQRNGGNKIKFCSLFFVNLTQFALLFKCSVPYGQFYRRQTPISAAERFERFFNPGSL
jgi:hypothetical protein